MIKKHLYRWKRGVVVKNQKPDIQMAIENTHCIEDQAQNVNLLNLQLFFLPTGKLVTDFLSLLNLSSSSASMYIQYNIVNLKNLVNISIKPQNQKGVLPLQITPLPTENN